MVAFLGEQIIFNDRNNNRLTAVAESYFWHKTSLLWMDMWTKLKCMCCRVAAACMIIIFNNAIFMPDELAQNTILLLS